MTLEQRITALAQAIAADIKALNEQIMNPNFRQYQHQLFTSSGTWTVPDGVNMIWVDAVGGGDGGAGGYASATSGGGGAGGIPTIPFVMCRFPVTPGETLAITVGAGGIGGAVGARGGLGGITKILGSLHALSTNNSISAGPGPSPGTATAGGAATVMQTGYRPLHTGEVVAICTAGSGGAPGSGGGGAIGGQIAGQPQWYRPGGAAVGNLGGGGAGGGNLFGVSGAGGAGGSAGEDAPTYYTGYPIFGGCGGGGGANAAGGNGAPGMARIYWAG